MSQFAASSRYQPLREVEGYWDALRAGRLVPRRSDIDPRGIERALEYAFVLERIAPGLGRLRIAGSHLTDLLGMEVRGMPLSALFAAGTRGGISEVLEQVFSDPAKAELQLTSDRSLGKPALEGRMILLPLKSDLGDITRVLGCLVTQGRIGRAPRRFEIAGVEVRPLLGDAVVRDQDGETPATEEPAKTELPGLSEEAAQFEHGPKPYLRLVKTDHSE
ncbi:PAS domain-containing protein [Pseudooceanicola sp.]|uniref:PAS domain-containing protein n=1 Tax=Pseudooceanicola sp. TaxID=1914328 RepID=UPI0035C733A9